MTEKDRRIRSSGHSLMTAYAILIPLFWRVFLLVERGQDFRSHDAKGIIADVAVALGFIALLTPLARPFRMASVIMLTLWCILHYAIYEHIVALGELPNIAHIGYLWDPTFFFGSVLHVTHPVFLLTLSIAGALVGWRLRVLHDWPRRTVSALVCCVGLMTAVAFWPTSIKTMPWRQQNALIEVFVASAQALAKETALVDVIGESGILAGIDVSDVELAIVNRAFASDLAGQTRVAIGRTQRPNVLLILLEGVCGAHIEAICRPTGVKSRLSLPYLDELARAHLCYSNFLTHQGQTNRGLYSILAGDFPRLTTAAPKMAEIAGSGASTRSFLPEVLRKNGYATAFIQAAPLGFMMKDRFMPVVGFQTVLGDAAFDHAYTRNEWGVDDLAFFEEALDQLKAIAAKSDPWFVTLLTAGTHHPFLVPNSYRGHADETERVRSFYYADEALKWFLSKCESENLLRDALVIVTSDESLGLIGSADAITRRMSGHWGFAIAIIPDEPPQMITEPFCQSDLALSVMDYLQLTEDASDFIGRSMFRSYAQPRPLFFGSTYGRFVGMFDSAGKLNVFNDRFKPLYSADTAPNALFRIAPRAEEPDNLGVIAAVVRRSLGDHPPTHGRVITLADRPFLMSGDSRETYVFGHQYLAVDRDAVLVIELDVTVSTSEENRVKLQHRFWVGDSYPSKFVSPWLPDKGRYRVRCIYRTGAAQPEVFLRQLALREQVTDATIQYDRATITVVPAGDWDGPDLWPREFRILEED